MVTCPNGEALALFLCTPPALYAVNEHVSFAPYKTTFELAEVTVDGQHWSASGGGAEPGDRAVARPSTGKPGFSGASGNAC